MTPDPNLEDSLRVLLKALRLSAFRSHYADFAVQAGKDDASYGQYLHNLAEVELRERQDRRTARSLKLSQLPLEKTLATLQLERFSGKLRKQIYALCEGDFLARAENVLVFGLPGRGKTHLCCAIGHALIRKGYRVLFAPTYQLVQRLLVAKRELALEKYLKRLDRFDAVILDDLGYVQQDRDEMEVLFTFLAERYERKSVLISSNLVFSEWDRIFKDPMTTACAIDRLVHHSVILELSGASYRATDAHARTSS
jgi:DNA replication protein DnaC